MYYSEGMQTGTLGSNVVLADTGACVTPNTVDPAFWVSCNVAAVVELQLRNAANDGNVYAHRFWISAAEPLVSGQIDFGMAVDEDQRIRLVLVTGIIGSVQGTLFCQAIN